MNAGEIAQAGSPQDMYEKPCSEFVAGFMGEAVLFDGQADHNGGVQVGPLRITPSHTVATGPVKVAIRPEAWRVLPATENGLAGTVSKTAYLGSFQELTVDTALGPVFIISPDVRGSWPVSTPVCLQLSANGVSVVAA